MARQTTARKWLHPGKLCLSNHSRPWPELLARRQARIPPTPGLEGRGGVRVGEGRPNPALPRALQKEPRPLRLSLEGLSLQSTATSGPAVDGAADQQPTRRGPAPACGPGIENLCPRGLPKLCLSSNTYGSSAAQNLNNRMCYNSIFSHPEHIHLTLTQTAPLY